MTATTLKFSPGNHSYRLDGKPVPGVTTLLNKGLPKPALTYWSAKMVAEYVADNESDVEALRRAGRGPMVAALKATPWQSRDTAAIRGTDVHALAENLIHGREVQVPDHLAPYVEGYVKWLDAWQPEAILTERPCGNRHWWYAGTFDVIYRLRDGRTILADNKTGSGVYGDAALQLAGYAGAEFYVDDAGDEQPLPAVDGLAVIHITANGTDLYEVADPEAAWKDFLHVAWVAKSVDRIKDQLSEPSGVPS